MGHGTEHRQNEAMQEAAERTWPGLSEGSPRPEIELQCRKGVEVRLDNRDELDEIVAFGATVHLERMSASVFNLIVESGGHQVIVNIGGDRGAKVWATVFSDEQLSSSPSSEGSPRPDVGADPLKTLSDCVAIMEEHLENEHFVRRLRGGITDDDTPMPHIRVFEDQIVFIRHLVDALRA